MARPWNGTPDNPAPASYMPRSRCCSEGTRGDASGGLITSLTGGGVSVTRAPYADKYKTRVFHGRDLPGATRD